MEMPIWFLLAVLVAIALAAPRYGVDSRWVGRPGEPPPPPRPQPTPFGDLATLWRYLSRRVPMSSRRPNGKLAH
jgi:hypothetical protein